MNRTHLIALVLALLGAAPAPLVVGAVRDQHGAPIEDARVRLLAGGRTVGTTTTGRDGTFSAAGSADRVRIECAYCRPTEVPVGSDGTAIAVVVRYDAMRSDAPSDEDLAHLPYARIESDISLTPFVVLNQSSRPLTGASLDDRNAYPQSGLLLVNGVPDYDIVTGATPFDTIPAFGGTSVSVSRADDAYSYGDVANAGAFSVSTSGAGSAAFSGSDNGARAAVEGGAASGSAAWSDWSAGDRRALADFSTSMSSGTTQGTFAISSAEGSLDSGGHSALDSSFSSARATIQNDGRLDVFASANVDRATYDYQSTRAPRSAEWTDVDITASVRSDATIAPFAVLEARTSSGTYWTLPSDYGSAASVLQQTRGVAGVTITQPGYEAEFSLGTDGTRYAGGGLSEGDSSSAPSASGTLDAKLAPDWTLHVGAESGYVLQTFLGLYDTSGLSPVDATSLSDATLTYDSESRIRASLTTLRSNDANGDATSSAGASLAWQVAPDVSLRAWLLRAQSNVADPQTVGSAWLTYQTTGIRVDAVWRRDLLDHLPDAHLDASIGGALGRNVQWFVATERRAGIRATDLGVRF